MDHEGLNLKHQLGSLPVGWRDKLGSEAHCSYFEELQKFLMLEQASTVQVQPQSYRFLRALEELDLPDVRVVILGQDPYPTVGHAIGRAFAVPNEVLPKPPSLQNIFKELASDLGMSMDPRKQGSDLSGWVAQGVLLLNTTLSVRAGAPLSHQGKGWERFTDRVIEVLGERQDPLIFLLWGSPARKKKALISGKHHRVLESAHPSPLSAYRGFFGSRPFSETNQILRELGEAEIDWVKTSLT